MASCSEAGRRHCSPRSMSSSAGWRKPKSGSTSPSGYSRKGATLISSRGRTEGCGRHPDGHPHFRGRRVHRDGLLADRPAGGGDVRTQLAEQREALDQELEAVRREVAELAERMDFAERLLAQNREGQRIGPGK